MNIIPPTTTVCFLLTVQHSLHTTQRLHKMYSTGLHTLYNYTAATSFFYITLTFFPSLYCTHFLVISIPHSLSSHLYTPRHSLYSHLYTTLTFLSSPFFVYCSNFWNNVSYCDAQSCPKALPNNNNYSEVPPLSAAIYHPAYYYHHCLFLPIQHSCHRVFSPCISETCSWPNALPCLSELYIILVHFKWKSAARQRKAAHKSSKFPTII